MMEILSNCQIIIVVFSITLIAPNVAKKNDNLVVEFAKKEGSSVFRKDHTAFCVLIESKQSEDYDDFIDEFQKAAENFEKNVKFVFINTDLEENWEVIEYLGLIAEDVPAVVFIDLEHGMSKYKADFDEITKKNIIQFTEDCLNGKNAPFIKSDEIPEDWDKRPVIELVSKNFEEAVFNTKRSTFVFFYSPTCMACQNTMPEIEKLAERFKTNENVVIAKLNAVSNEVPGIPVVDVPTMALFVNGSPKPIYHVDDERTVTEFTKFINKNLEEAKSTGDKKPKKKKSQAGKKKKEEL